MFDALKQVMRELGCEPDANHQFCATCNNQSGEWDDYFGCATARTIAIKGEGVIMGEEKFPPEVPDELNPIEVPVDYIPEIPDHGEGEVE